MNFTMKEIVKFVSDNDVKFIRLAFADLRGTFKSVMILPTELPRAFEKGVSIDGSAVDGFSDVCDSDLFLRPDPSTLTLLPWTAEAQREIRFICDIVKPDGMPFASDVRSVLKRAVQKAFDKGITVKIGAESEFYLFRLEDGSPTKKPIDGGGYMDMYPLDMGENIRHEICLCMEEMDMFPETSHHEQGAGQNEIDFRYSDALSAADNFLSFKSAVKYVAGARGMYACFMPKPLVNEAGNGLHINISLEKDGENIFDLGENCSSDDAVHFLAGILSHAGELTAVLNTTNNSFERLGCFEAPKVVAWSRNNRSAYIRIPSSSADGNRMELRVADNAVNPYLAFAAIIEAGLDGIEKKTRLTDECRENLYSEKVCEKFTPVVKKLDDALAAAKNSKLLESTFGREMLDKYISMLTTDGKRTGDNLLFKRL